MTTLDQFQRAAQIAQESIDRLIRYEKVLIEAEETQGTIFKCDKCRKYSVRTHQGRRLCKECRR